MTWVNYKEIKSRVKIDQVLARYGVLDTLTAKGDNLVGRCEQLQLLRELP
jgi:hypothetical protein